MNYHGKRFSAVGNSPNGETSGDTIFAYQQQGNIVTAHYAGGAIVQGHLMGLVDEGGNIEMRYHHVNVQEELLTGVCHSRPERMDNGKIRLYETWQWTCGDQSTGESVIKEI